VVSPALRPLFERAWIELLNDGSFERLERGVTSREFDFQLREHGLYGAQLELKTQLYQQAPETLAEERGRSSETRWKRLLGWTLKAADVALGSIVEAIPMTAPAKEFKEALEAALDEEGPVRGTLQRWWQRFRP
jgi:hypothetical protein